MPKKITVLITRAGAPGAPGIIRSLRLANNRLRIIATDIDHDSAGFFMADKHYIVPPLTHKNFIKKLLNISTKEKIDIIIPFDAGEMIKIADNIYEFTKRNIKIPISTKTAIGIASNKYTFMQRCANEGVPTPKFFLARNFIEFKKAVKNLGYPKKNVCFKPPIADGMRGFRILTKKLDRLEMLLHHKPTDTLTSFENIAPILQKARPFPELLVMEYLPGKEYSIDSIADHGVPITVIPRVRNKIRMGISFESTVVNNKKLIMYSKRIISSLKLHGYIGFQFKCDERETPKIIECNPRVQGTMVAATAAGVNLPYLGILLALNKKIRPPKVKWGTKLVRYWGSIYYDTKRRSAVTL